MIFNKNQKVLTLIYFLGLFVIFFLYTPYYLKVTGSNGWENVSHTEITFGNFFSITEQINYSKFFIEIVGLTIVYYLSTIILKSKNNNF